MTNMIESTKFKHKVTGEIKTQIPIMEMNDYESFEPKNRKLFVYDDCLSCGNESRLNKDGLCEDCWSKNK